MKIKKTTKTEFRINGMPIVGKPELLENVKSWLMMDWDGNVIKVIPDKSLLPTGCIPIDKGRCGYFGVDKTGHIICGLVYWHEEKPARFEVYATDKADPHVTYKNG